MLLYLYTGNCIFVLLREPGLLPEQIGKLLKGVKQKRVLQFVPDGSLKFSNCDLGQQFDNRFSVPVSLGGIVYSFFQLYRSFV